MIAKETIFIHGSRNISIHASQNAITVNPRASVSTYQGELKEAKFATHRKSYEITALCPVNLFLDTLVLSPVYDKNNIPSAPLSCTPPRVFLSWKRKIEMSYTFSFSRPKCFLLKLLY